MNQLNLLKQSKQEDWTLVIRAHRPWFDVRWSDIWRYRDLLALLVRRDFVAVYKQTILGPLWFLLQPLLTAVVFTVIFGRIAQIPTEGMPPMLFYLSGTIVWSYFAACLQGTSSTFVANAAMFSKVYFPRLIVPLATVISSLTSFAIQFLMLTGFIAYFRFHGVQVGVSVAAVAVLPVLICQMAALGLGCGIMVSALTTKYRDLSYLMQFGIQLWMFATPVVYPSSKIPTKWQWLMQWNPMAPVVETFRSVMLGKGELSLVPLLYGWLGTMTILLIGIALFSRVEQSFADTV